MKIITWILLLCLMCVPILSGAAADVGAVLVDGQALAADAPVILSEGTTYLPLRAFCESLSDCTVTWNAAARTAVVKAPNLTISVAAGSRYLAANDRCLYLKDGARIVDGRLLVPVRALTQAFGAAIDWSAANRTVTVSTAEAKPITPGASFYNERDLYWLSRIIEAESGSEPLEGKIAVGDVVLNRVKSDEYPDTVYDVIFDNNYGVQFTPTANRTIYNTPSAESVAAAKICLEGVSVVGDSLYFLNPDTSSSTWIIRNCKYVMTIGGHSFYA